MSRYKGRQSARSVEQDFPHFVDIAVPPGGLGKKLNAMYEFHAQHGIAPGGMMLTAVSFDGALLTRL